MFDSKLQPFESLELSKVQPFFFDYFDSKLQPFELTSSPWDVVIFMLYYCLVFRILRILWPFVFDLSAKATHAGTSYSFTDMVQELWNQGWLRKRALNLSLFFFSIFITSVIIICLCWNLLKPMQCFARLCFYVCYSNSGFHQTSKFCFDVSKQL